MKQEIKYLNDLNKLVSLGAAMSVRLKYYFTGQSPALRELDEKRLIDLVNQFELTFDHVIAKEGVKC